MQRYEQRGEYVNACVQEKCVHTSEVGMGRGGWGGGEEG